MTGPFALAAHCGWRTFNSVARVLERAVFAANTDYTYIQDLAWSKP
jgi:hypothetical protein